MKTLATLTLLTVSVAASAADSVDQRLEALTQRLAALEQALQETERALDEPVISEDEPAIAARLKAAESRVAELKAAANTAEALDGITVEGGFTSVAQRASGDARSELNYRADIEVTAPAGELGNASGVLFGHFRMGQGLGLENPSDALAAVNASSFQRPGTEAADSTVLLAQLWYQIDVPLPLGGNPGLSREHVEFGFGKMDPFGFFDQNAVVDDETRGPLNQAFVHNPLLDAGGDVGVDAFGFTPGVRLAYVNEQATPSRWGLSLGVFGAGAGAEFDQALHDPFVIVQADREQRFFGGLLGHYRVYLWRNDRGENYDGEVARHQGVGVSVDQRLSERLTWFMRYGQQQSGATVFDRALTSGVEINGDAWRRGADAVGVALARLQANAAWQSWALAQDGIERSSGEQIAELYYRFRVNGQWELSVDYQRISTPGAQRDADAVNAFGLRSQLTF